jgi:Smg protein
LDKDYKILLDAFGFESTSVDELVNRTGLPSQSVASMLLILELEGAVGIAGWAAAMCACEASAPTDTERQRCTESMMDNSVFDILIYVFDRYMLEELPASAERETLARDLKVPGSARPMSSVRWTGWQIWPRSASARTCAATAHFASMRQRSSRDLDSQCRGLLTSLEAARHSLASQREIVIDRLLALEAEELDLEQVKWVVLMVLSSQPGQELAYARMEDLVFDVPQSRPH